MGRPSKCKSELIAKVSSAVTQGCTIEAACAASGISTSTFRDWRAQGRQGVAPYSAFLAAIKKAEAAAEQRLLGIINEAAPKTWQAAAWILERRFPKRWARTAAVGHKAEAKNNEQSAGVCNSKNAALNPILDPSRFQHLTDEELMRIATHTN